jgi:hypothetical protein
VRTSEIVFYVGAISGLSGGLVVTLFGAHLGSKTGQKDKDDGDYIFWTRAGGVVIIVYMTFILLFGWLLIYSIFPSLQPFDSFPLSRQAVLGPWIYLFSVKEEVPIFVRHILPVITLFVLWFIIHLNFVIGFKLGVMRSIAKEMPPTP